MIWYLIMVLSLFSFCSGDKANIDNDIWSAASDCGEYSCKEFFSYNTNKIIDFKNVDYKLLRAAIFHETNVFRLKHNQVALKYSSYLDKASQIHADDMLRLNFVSHKSKVKKHKTIKDRLIISGHSGFGSAGENILQIYGNPPSRNKPHTYISLAKHVINLWGNSKGHRANMLGYGYSYLGIGAKARTYYPFQFYCVQVFSSKQK